MGLAFAVGFAIGAVFVGSPTQVLAPDAEENTGPAPPTVVTTPRETELGLSETVPGYSDTLVAIAQPDIGLLNIIGWPAESGLNEFPFATGQDPAFDVSGQVVAVTQEVPDQVGAVLTIGRVTNLSTLASDVTSYAWHDFRPGHIAYTTSDGQVWTAFSDLQARTVGDPLDPGAELVAWGDWGFAIAAQGEGTVLLNSDAEVRTSRPGTVLTSRADGWLVIDEGELRMVSSGGGVRGLPASAQATGTVLAASFSPSGDLLAISGTESLVVVPVEGDGIVSRFEAGGGERVSWSSDGRFVLATGSRGIGVLDLERGVRKNILSQHHISDVISIRGTGS